MNEQIANFLLNISLNDVQKYSFESTMMIVAGQFHDVSAAETDKLASDFALPVSSAIRRAIVGRYPLCLKLCDDFNNWKQPRPECIDSSGVLNEPCVIAAAIALRPYQYWEWNLVDAWSRVYRHALAMDVSIDDFEAWCEFRDPNISHDFLTSQLPWLNCRASLLNGQVLPASGSTSDNA